MLDNNFSTGCIGKQYLKNTYSTWNHNGLQFVTQLATHPLKMPPSPGSKMERYFKARKDADGRH